MEITPKDSLKYLGVWIDKKLKFSVRVNKTVTRASQTTMALARIMPNIGGPQASKRKVLAAVANSILLYAVQAWSTAIKTKKNRKAYQREQRLSALRICSAYRTAPTEALLVIAEQPPIDLLIEETSYMAWKKNVGSKLGRKLKPKPYSNGKNVGMIMEPKSAGGQKN
ncbi:uncharacterized protein LOC130902980 [Diorhabda carinulata]|uniref:uncharacterized protein LOC130894167 n=1 Tax=Diorhabda carinulata TaxID=1163345 RepID=UPI0025A1FE2B|nr:uncharacterized protein LOC130894167 [Diorhabda carinulata]XP_057671250.1 uncharacterized protein LOC130902980 [Diorhabda carinulata]